MNTTTRLAAYALSFAAGYGVPLVALAAVQDGVTGDRTAFHSSSRILAAAPAATQDEMEALRLRLWALTEHGGTIHCNVDGVTAPCANTVSYAEDD